MTEKKTKTTKRKTKKQKQKRQNSKEYTNILLLFTALFVLMTGYLIWFQAFKSRGVINNSYNARIEDMENQVIRGSILSSDGQVLAATEVDADGTEQRVYPFGCTFSHVLGYSEYGKTGIESIGNFQLTTSNAYFVERFLNELKGRKNIGDSLVTTLDVDLQTVAHDALGTHQGAVIVMEPSTGDVLAMVSKPDYDPSEIAQKWDSFSNSGNSVLLNRATQGLYPPGSTFKMLTLLEYLREHQMDGSGFFFHCTGRITSGNTSISCYKGKAHGDLDLTKAFAKSCNGAFAEIGRELDVPSFRLLAGQMLFGQELPVALPHSRSSFSLKESDPEILKMMTAIGQGDTLMTPMHMALIMSAVANDGVLMTPRFLKRTESYTGSQVESYPVTTYGQLMAEEEAKTLQPYLRAVVEDGTGTELQSDAYEAAGKTGTAEYSSNKKQSHAWFAGYASGSKDDLVVVAIVEGAGSGSEYAVPIAKKVFDAYYKE